MATVKFTKDHEWIRAEGSTGIVGISDYAQAQLGDLVFVELPEVGKKAGQGRRGRRYRVRKGGRRGLCPGQR